MARSAGSGGRFASLSIPSYRWFWISTLAAFCSIQMQMVASGWLVYSLDQSTFQLALAVVSFAVPMSLLSLLGGVLADRWSKRNLVMLAQFLTAVASIVVGLLVLEGTVQFWHLILAGVLNGVLAALNGPSRMALIPELVSRQWVVNATALNQAAMNLTRVLGPAMAGGLIPFLGVSGVYFLMAGLSLFACLTMLGVRRVAGPPRDWSQWRVGRQMTEGIRYVLARPMMVSLLLTAIAAVVLGMPFQFLMPAFVVEALEMEAVALGMLMTISGVGAFAGSLVVAGMGGLRRKGAMLLVNMVGWGVSLLLLSLATGLEVAAVGMFLVGFTSAIFLTLNTSIIQLLADADMYGRVMSLNMLTFGLMPLAVTPLGALAESVGTDRALTLCAVLLVGVALLSLSLNRSLRRLEV